MIAAEANCIFMAPSVEYLGHCIDRMSRSDVRVRTINEAQVPKNVMDYLIIITSLCPTLPPSFPFVPIITKTTEMDQFIYASRHVVVY